MKKVLVIGGSYFIGRVFSIFSSQRKVLELHVANRGKYQLGLPGVTEYRLNRHDTEQLKEIFSDMEFDTLVDFCAYEPGDISSILKVLSKKVRQYIFISTCSVYDPADGKMRTEESPIRIFSGESDPISEYIRKKVDLERELKDICREHGTQYTILRPTFAYGPFNYVPRESYFIERIVKKQPVPFPADSNARFSLVYVTDIARMIELCVGNDISYGETFNLSAPEHVTYSLLMEEFERANEAPFKIYPLSIEQISSEKIPIPFPVTNDELYSGEKFEKTFGFSYTDFSQGMEKTFRAFKKVFD
jgi:nucleoside-diphosphate-sugar epimerase